MADKELEGLKKAMMDYGVIAALQPAANAASRLRACGIRLVGSPEAIEALQQLENEGDEQAALILGNLFPQGHPEVSSS